MPFFKPDEFLTSVTKVDVDELVQRGIRYLFLDLDNTLLPRDTGVIPDDVHAWLDRAHGAGLTLHLVSNNWHSSVFDEARELGLPIIHKSMKPFPAAYMVARHRMGARRRESIAIGDQLMTDVIGAHLSGMKAILVLPQAKKDLKHTLLLRNLEKVFLGDLKPTR